MISLHGLIVVCTSSRVDSTKHGTEPSTILRRESRVSSAHLRIHVAFSGHVRCAAISISSIRAKGIEIWLQGMGVSDRSRLGIGFVRSISQVDPRYSSGASRFVIQGRS